MCIYIYIYMYVYMVFNICMHWCNCLILAPKTCNLTTGYPPKLIITHLFKQNMFQRNILWLSRMVKHITEYHIILVLSQYIPLVIYTCIYIYIIIYHYIPVYPTDIPLISHWYPRPPCWNVLECTRASIVEPPFFVFELSWSHGIQIWKPKELIV